MARRTISRRSAGAGMLAATALVGLSACSGGAAVEDTSTATSGDITWWGWTPDKVVADALIEAFTKEYPDIHVEFVSKPISGYDAVLSPAITSSEGPDVFNVAPGSSNGGVDTFHGGAIDLGPAVAAELGEDWKDKLATAGVEGLMVEDKVVGLSAGSVCSGTLWINQDLFDEHGLSAPTTLEEWLQVCEAFESADQGGFVQGAGNAAFDMDTFEAIMENIEPGLYADASRGEAPYVSSQFTQGMEIWKSLFDDGIMQKGAIGLQQYPDANNAFMAGDYAMVMMGTWYMQYAVRSNMIAAMEAAGVSDPEPFTLIPVDFPDVAGTGNTGSLFGDADYGLAVSGRSDQQAAATTFAVWLATSEAGQQAVADTLNDIPSLTGVQPNWDAIELVDPEAQSEALKALTERAAAATEPRFGTVDSTLNDAFQETLIGVPREATTIEEALDILQTANDSK
ncbi:ABC transporter substrate-binding protein [Brachybacterium tyrofermentans]|uniref:ABC transporter substrate-binding protein n=1 Tax=Brachybacterium tyrofermentans TaxID=47848 RepID=UPI003FD58DBB